MMLHPLQIKGLFNGQAHKDANIYLKNFIDVCFPFDISHISHDLIWLRLIPFSLMDDVVLWLRELPMCSILHVLVDGIFYRLVHSTIPHTLIEV